jgi:glutamine synthetase
MGLNARQKVLLKLTNQIPPNSKAEKRELVRYFGENTFNDKVMRERLSKEIYKKLQNTIKKGEKLDMSIANSVAHAMKEWALDKGVTHFTHWFQPQTGLTAEKHDSFLEFDDGQPLERFRGNQLVQGEPDASSFPSGGSRTTFEARGYTMWDPSSPAFIIEGPSGSVLCIPSIFISYTGDALDKKTPLLRANEAISKSAKKILELFGHSEVTRVTPTIGTEQEYFLIDKAFFNLRKDLQFTGRTLLGASSPKDQQLDDHYFGAIKERALAFMQDAERELYKLGIPAKTRHNEVAPHQYELAPIFGEANVAADRNQMIMEVIKKTANRHGLALLLHEKPFAGINGSGKHNNWSLSDCKGTNLLDPGETPEQNLQFLVFLTATIYAVYKYSGLLRMSIASAYNDHRLGANEAPPAIISVFLGERLTEILNAIQNGKKAKPVKEYIIDLGLAKLPSIFRDHTDRNRTSPFAFTGEKFEFRALGSSASVSLANTILSASVADSLDVMHQEIESVRKESKSLEESVLSVLQKYLALSAPVRFEGNNYGLKWEKEAEKRGLPNVKKTGYALDFFISEENINMLVRHKVFNKREIHSRYNTKLEQYVTALEIEAETLIDMLSVQILPAAISYKNQLINTIATAKSAGLPEPAFHLDNEILLMISEKLNIINTKRLTLKEKLEDGAKINDLPIKAKYFADTITELLEDIRTPTDELEKILPDELWPLPKYSEMLFIM